MTGLSSVASTEAQQPRDMHIVGSDQCLLTSPLELERCTVVSEIAASFKLN